MSTIQDVARVAGVSTATVSHVVNNSRRVTPATAARVERAIAQLNFVPNATGRLLASGLLREGAPEQMRARLGRPPIGLSFREEHTFFMGINIGVRRSQVGAALVNGRLLAEASFDTPADPGVALQQVRASVEQLC